MLKEVHDMAGQHEVIAENTSAQLISPIQKSVVEFKNDRKKVCVQLHQFKLSSSSNFKSERRLE